MPRWIRWLFGRMGKVPGSTPVADPLIFTVTRSFTARTRADSFEARTVTRAVASRTRTGVLSG